MDADVNEEAADLAGRLTPREREALLVSCWMSHDARWYMAAVRAVGLEAASNMNGVAAREQGKSEARRVMKALGLPPPKTARECLVAQEAIAHLLVPDLVDYRISHDAQGVEMCIDRRFAYENVVRAGVAEQYECGIFARLSGWWDAFGVGYELSPPLGKCLKASGRDCAYRFSVGGAPSQ